MEHQPGFSEYEFAGKRKVTRREKFLASMEEVVPWDDLLAAIKPAYPDGRRGRPPIGLERGLLMREWKIDWQIAKRRQPIRKMEDGPEKDGLLAVEKKRKPRCGRLSNIRSTSSRISSDIARHATGAWRKTTINCKSSSGWAISWSPPAKWRERGPQTAE